MPTASRSLIGTEDLVSQLSDVLLRRLLAPHSEWLHQHGIKLGRGNAPLDRESIARALRQPDSLRPPLLTDAIHQIDLASSPDGSDRLHDIAEAEGLTIPTDRRYSPADTAAFIWLENAQVLRRANTEHTIANRRRMVHFPRGTNGAVEPLSEVKPLLTGLASHLRRWQRSRNRASLVTPFLVDEGNGDRIIAIRSSGIIHRRDVVGANNVLGRVEFRELLHSFVVLPEGDGTLDVLAPNPSIRDRIRKGVGLSLYGHEDAFVCASVYAFDRVIQEGRPAFAPIPGDGVASARVGMLELVSPNAAGFRECIWGNDVFSALAAKGRTLDETDEIVQVRMNVLFDGATKPRAVTLRCDGHSAKLNDAEHDAFYRYAERFRVGVACAAV